MKFKGTYLTILLLAFTISNTLAQYNNPNSIAYDPGNKNYYISNTGNGTVTKLNASYQTSTVITNLTEPKGLFFITAGTTQLLIVLDVNKIKVFDPSSYSLIQSISVTGATNLEDAILDLNNANVFYLSDRGGNKIIRGELGPAPFYIPSFSDLATGVDRPTGLWFDSNGRLLMVQDTTNSPISEVDTSNGNISVVKATDLDYLNSIIQDGQGNYYISSWGDDNLYRFAPDFSDSVKITTLNNPAGFYMNINDDLLLTACSNCNKVEFFKLHAFIPWADITGCPGDSATVLFNPSYKSVGTYGSNNQYFVDVSDDLGKFSPPRLVGRISLDSDPDSIRIRIPSDKYGTGNLLYRVRSTNPFILSPEYKLTISALPNAKASDYDVLGTCINATLNLGGNPIKDNVYSWSPGSKLNDSAIANPAFTSSTTGNDTLYLTVTSTRSGCSASDTVIISTKPDLSLPQLNEIVSFCSGDSVEIGVKNVTYKFKWTPNFALSSDTVANPKTFTPGNIKYYVSFTDIATGCKGNDSVTVLVNPTPALPDIADSFSVCRSEDLTLTIDPVTGIEYSWEMPDYLDKDTGNSVVFNCDKSLLIYYRITAMNVQECKAQKVIKVLVLDKPSVRIDFFNYIDGALKDSVELNWEDTTGNSFVDLYAIDTTGVPFLVKGSIPEGLNKFPVINFERFRKNGKIEFRYFLEAINPNSCESVTDTLTYLLVSARTQELIPFAISPNPASRSIQILCPDKAISKVAIYNSTGRLMLETDNDIAGKDIDVSTFASDIYHVIIFNEEGNFGIEKLILIK